MRKTPPPVEPAPKKTASAPAHPKSTTIKPVAVPTKPVAVTVKAAVKPTPKPGPAPAAKSVPAKAPAVPKTVSPAKAAAAPKSAPPRGVAEAPATYFAGSAGRAWRMSGKHAVAYVHTATLAGELLATEPRRVAVAAMAVYYDRKGRPFAWQFRFDTARWAEVTGRLL